MRDAHEPMTPNLRALKTKAHPSTLEPVLGTWPQIQKLGNPEGFRVWGVYGFRV